MSSLLRTNTILMLYFMRRYTGSEWNWFDEHWNLKCLHNESRLAPNKFLSRRPCEIANGRSDCTTSYIIGWETTDIIHQNIGRSLARGCSCINSSCWNWDGAVAAISTGGWLAFCSSFDLITDLAGGLFVMLTGWRMNKNVRTGNPVITI